MKPSRVIIADDSDLTILGVRTVLADQSAYRVVGLARDLTMLLGLLTVTQPDIVICGGGCYVEADIFSGIRHLNAIAPETRKLLIGAILDGVLIRDLLDAGADGYLHRSDELSLCLPDALHSSAKGKQYLSSTARAAYRAAISDNNRTKPGPLTDELHAVLYALAQGHTVSEIAYKLNISEKRVYRLRRQLKKRFNANTNEHLIQRAVMTGFLILSAS